MLPAFPASLDDYYAQFTAEFLGSPLALAKSLCRQFGGAFLPPPARTPLLCPTFLTEGYDDAAVEHFRARRRLEDGPIRLAYYRFYPEPDGHRIEFWEVPLCDGGEASGETASRAVSGLIAAPGPAPVPPLHAGEETRPTTPFPADRPQPDGGQAAALRTAQPAVCEGASGMSAAAYLSERQVLWVRRRGIALEGSAGDRGRLAYTPTLEENLFEPLTEEARREYGQGQGDELARNMRAVHSSSALACNLFHYWKSRGEPAPAAACGLPAGGLASVRFEPRLPVADGLDRSVFPYDPNPDAVFLYAPGQKVKAAAVECKFGEPYDGRGHGGIKRAYLVQPGLWNGLPHSRDLATRISPDDNEFEHLHAAQLLKHLLGLKHAYGLGGFVLAYLWYDVPGDEGWRHRQEVERFAEIVGLFPGR